MTLRALLRRWLLAVHDDTPVSLSTRATFAADAELERRIRAAREAMGTVEVPKLIEEQPDYGERQPVDYDRLPP